MGLLTPKGKKGDKKKDTPKNTGQQSKFLPGKASSKGAGVKKPLTGGTQRGS